MDIFTTDYLRHTAEMAVVETLWQLHTLSVINSCYYLPITRSIHGKLSNSILNSHLRCDHIYVNKSDISFLKTSRAFDVLESQTLLVSDSVYYRHHEYLAARFWRFRSRSASCRRIYVASASRYPSRNRNCGRLLIAATQSSRLN